MKKHFDVFYKNSIVGTAERIVDGLFYKFSCKCKLPEEKIYKLVVQSQEKTYNLGVLIPANGIFQLNTAVPIKRIGKGSFILYVVSRDINLQQQFFPVSEYEEFHELTRLSMGQMEYRNGVAGITFPIEFPNQQDNDQNR